MASREGGSPVGPGRVLTLVYAFFVLAAGARSAVQLSTRAAEAPVAYTLSAVATLVYLAGLLAVARADRHEAGRVLAFRLAGLELLGVVLVGTLSVGWPQLFPKASVWSMYGAGYGFVPLALPLLTLLWLRSSARQPGRRRGVA